MNVGLDAVRHRLWAEVGAVVVTAENARLRNSLHCRDMFVEHDLRTSYA
ncbi:hypothetical protein [Streptosporangium sp. CA-115845]